MRIGRKWVSLIIISILGCSCGDNEDSQVPLRFDTAPAIEMAPNANAPLVGVLTLETNRPTSVTVTLDDGSSVSTIEFDELDTQHALNILGFKPDRDYDIGVRVTNSDDESLDAASLEATLGPLPDDFPILDLVISDEANMEPGVTMFAVQAANESSYVTMVDSRGEVVWYLHQDDKPGDARRLANGNLLLDNGNRLSTVEVEMRGDVVRTWHAANSSDLANSIPVVTDSFHHEVFPMPPGISLPSPPSSARLTTTPPAQPI